MNNQRSSNSGRRQRNRNRNQHLDQNQPQRNQHHQQQRQQHHQNQQSNHTRPQSSSQHEKQQDFQPQHASEGNFVANETGSHSQTYQETYDATHFVPVTTGQHQTNYVQMQAYQQHPSQQYLAEQQAYINNPLDEAAEDVSGATHCAARRAIDSVYAMPISDHVYYNSYESYNALMMEQQASIVNMMNSLSTCYCQPVDHANYSSSRSGLEFRDIPASIDKYEMLHKINNEMLDEIGHNLDYADGSYQTEAQSVQATLLAANQNKPLSSSHSLVYQPFMNRDQFHAGLHLNPSSSSPLITRPSEISLPSSFQQYPHHYENPNQQQRYNNLNPNQRRYPRYSKNANFFRSCAESNNIPRPQDQFIEKIDNSLAPFKPVIKEKPNASFPLSLTAKIDKQNNSYYDHPYADEIEQFQVDTDLLVYRDPIEPADINSTPILMVETITELKLMCSDIEGQQEFAVDVEHHSYRSYQGLTCLLQISTRTKDYVIDAIKLRSDLHQLNKSFTNPNIVKIFHGADCDILWLQRDFGVYVVNLFDTSRAAKLMKFPHLSLAYLLRHYCNIEPDKSYQLADWRERPIPPAMLQYARSDTHFLLYIYDRLKNDLVGKDNEPGVGAEMIRSVFQKGKEICLKRYEKPPFSENSHLSVLRKSRIPFNAKQMYALKEMYAWRDRIGRELDESVGYVLPNSMMMRIAEALPREPQGITALVKPVPQVLNKYLNDVHAIILKALDVPLDEKSKLMAENPMSANPSLRSIDLDSVTLKQDTAHAAGVQENSLPNLLEDRNHYKKHVNRRTNGYVHHGNTYRGAHQDHSTLYKFVDPSYNKRNDLNMMMTGVHNAIEHFAPPYERYKESTR